MSDPIRQIATGDRHEMLWALANRLMFLRDDPRFSDPHWVALVDVLRHGLVTFADGVSTDSGPYSMEIGTDEAACIVAAILGSDDWYRLRAAALGGKGGGDATVVTALRENPGVASVDWEVERRLPGT